LNLGAHRLYRRPVHGLPSREGVPIEPWMVSSCHQEGLVRGQFSGAVPGILRRTTCGDTDSTVQLVEEILLDFGQVHGLGEATGVCLPEFFQHAAYDDVLGNAGEHGRVVQVRAVCTCEGLTPEWPRAFGRARVAVR